MSELRSCAKRVGASRSRLYPDGPCVHLSGPAYIPKLHTSRILPLDQHVLYGDCCKKCIISSSGSLLLFCTAYHQNTVGAYDQSYTFAQSAV